MNINGREETWKEWKGNGRMEKGQDAIVALNFTTSSPDFSILRSK